MELIFDSAVALSRRLAAGEVTVADLLDALQARIAAADPPGAEGGVNALPTLCFERARMQLSGPAPLNGLPVAIKDLTPVAGVRTTWGCPIYADHVPEASGHVVERLEARGGVVYAKSNTPEFGAGANTFNEVFGATRNPWDAALSVAGSSGGSAAALRIGTAWLATGSDLGGSLRNPASFCGVVGLRPTPGRVPHGPAPDPWNSLSVDGPMARTVADCALLLDAMSGPDRREPLSLPAEAEGAFLAAADAPRPPRRAAFSRDLGGLTPVDPEVAGLCEAAARRLEAMGVTVEEAAPDLSGAHECFQTLRALGMAASLGPLLAERRDALKPELVWNIEKGLALTGEQVGRALRERGRIMNSARRFFEDYDVLLCPATVLPPFPVETRWPESCAGTRFETYIDWLAIAYAVTLTGCPALSLPCGFTRSGLPVGLQMVGPQRGEAALLAQAAALEAELGLDPRPIDPRPAGASATA